jgi:hypothetical protein
MYIRPPLYNPLILYKGVVKRPEHVIEREGLKKGGGGAFNARLLQKKGGIIYHGRLGTYLH